MTISDKSFAEHSKWLAFQRSSLNWPKYWRAVIFKLDRHCDPATYEDKYVVWPRNPEYQKYCDAEDAITNAAKFMTHKFGADGSVIAIPPLHLDPAYFDSLEDIDQWAQVAYRIS
jgi:hypothetical protein